MAVTAGCELAFGAVRSGRWSYLAVSGSFDVPQVLGSASTYLKAGIGGFQGRTLQAGDALPTKEITTTAIAVYKTLLAHSLGQRWAQAPWTSGPQPFTLQTEAPIIRAIAGPEYHLFDTASQQAFWQQPFTLSPHSDRMGARLQGPPLTLRQPQEILSTAVTFGTVQVPAGGSPIVLLADHQTTGGYPRIAQVISADFSRLAQAALGKPLRFQQVSLAEAQRAYLHQQQHLQQLERAIALRSLFT
jgi:antagonist of KipI